MTKLTLPAVLFFGLASAGAQDTTSEPSEPSVEELSQLLLQQKEIIEGQAKEIEALRERLSEVEALALSSHNRLQELEARPEEPSVEEAVEQRLAQLEQQVQRIPEVPTEAVEVEDFPGSIPIPGTDAAVKVGGQVRLTLVKTIGPLGVDDRFITSSIPIEGSQEAGKGSRLTFSARPSRLNFDFRTPTGVGSVRAFLEADFAGGSTNSFRLRHAYGQWGSFLGGQTWSTFSDPEAEPDGIDFEGLNAISLFRQQQIRWNKPLRENAFLAIAVENLSPDVTGATGVNQVPDIVARIRLDREEFPLFAFLAKGGHVQAAVLGRQIRAEPPDRPNETVSTAGFGANVSGQMFTKWCDGRDNFTFAVNAGTGIGRYITDLGTLGGQDATALILAVIGLFGVLSYTVAERTQELGVRIALGARTSQILALVLGQGMAMTFAGLATGLILAFALTRFLVSFLYGVSPTDLSTYLLITVALAGVAFLACYLPARRAAKVDPMVALRHE